MQTQIATAPYRIHRYPSQLIESWTLRNGQRATLRPVLPQDDVSEQAFVAALSVASRRNRFHGAVNGLSTARAEAMTNIDYQSHMGFVVTVLEGDTERVIADARYVMNDTGDSAEFAVVVADAWHGLGLGRRLISALCKCAHRAGARWLYRPCPAPIARWNRARPQSSLRRRRTYRARGHPLHRGRCIQAAH